MNKKLLAAAIASAAVVGAPAAFAESVVYGKMHTSVDFVDPPGGGNTNYQVVSRSSRLGFKGSEDLGSGLKAIYQIEFGISSDGGPGQSNPNTGPRTPVNNHRNTFIGLAGDWGTFLLGRHDTPAKMAFYASGNERLGDSAIDLNSGGLNPIGVFTEVRASNAIAYVSPNFSGFSVAAAVVPGEESGSGDTADGIADHLSFGVMYSGFGLKAGVGYEELNAQDGATASPDSEMWQAGASYTFSNFSVGAQYETQDNFGNVDGTDYEAVGLTGKATFGNNAISAVYTMSETENSAGATISDTDGWGVAGEHNFSKRTKAYVAYATSEDDEVPGDAAEHRFSLGMIHNF